MMESLARLIKTMQNHWSNKSYSHYSINSLTLINVQYLNKVYEI